MDDDDESVAGGDGVNGVNGVNRPNRQPPDPGTDLHAANAAASQLPAWLFGKGIVPIPPSDQSSLTSNWGTFSNREQLRPVLHLACNYPAEFLKTGSPLGTFTNAFTPQATQRSVSLAALFGLNDYLSKGFFIDGLGLREEELLPEKPEDRAQAIRDMKPLNSYMFRHRFKGELVEDCGDTPLLKRGADHLDPDSHDNGGKKTAIFSYTAPVQMYLVETLYSLNSEADADEDDRGAPCGIRVHTVVFSSKFQPSRLIHAVQSESEAMHRCGRATRCSNAKRKQGTERAAKQQRLSVADADVERSSIMKFAQIHDPSSYLNHIVSASGQGCGGVVKTPYPDMARSLANGCMHRPFSDHSIERQNALAPECMFNFRDGANPPSALFPYAEYKELYAYDPSAPNPPATVGRVADSFMVGADGISIKVHPKQLDPNNYFDSLGHLRFPFEDCVFQLANYSVPLRDCTNPALLNSGPQIGDDVLQAFLEVKALDDAVVACKHSVLLELARKKIERHNERVDLRRAGRQPDDADVREQELFGNEDSDDDAPIGPDWESPHYIHPTDANVQQTYHQLRFGGRPTFCDLRIKLRGVFEEKLSPSAVSVVSKRLRASKMLNADSLDLDAKGGTSGIAAALSLNAVAGSDEAVGVRESKLVTESIARTIEQVLAIVDSAVCLREEAGDAKATIEKFRQKCSLQALEWGIACFVQAYQDPQNSQSLYPVARSIWTTTPALFRKLPELGGNVTVSRDHPGRRAGSANFAFAFNNHLENSGLSVWGNWKNLLNRIYGGICGIQGRNNSIRTALHDGSLAPAGPKGSLREMLAVNGVKAMAKSFACARFGAIFNRVDDPDLKRTWWQSGGGASDRAEQSGGFAPSAGGVKVSDEALRAVASGMGANDAAALEAMQNMKQLATDGQTSRPRCVTYTNPNTGQTEYKQEIFIFKDNTTRVMCHNLGCNICHQSGKGPPGVPNADREALIDRIRPLLAVEGASDPAKIVSDDAFKRAVAAPANRKLITMHTLVVSLTYVCLEMASLVQRWQPPLQDEAINAWAFLDEYMLREHGIPKPDSRRQDLRKNSALQKAIELAVLRVFVFKEEAVGFKDMQPTKHHFPQDFEGKAISEVNPFEWRHLTNVFKVAVYDPEIVIEAWSIGLERSIYTTPDMFHILSQFGKSFGFLATPDNGSLSSGFVVESSIDPTKPKSVAPMPAPPNKTKEPKLTRGPRPPQASQQAPFDPPPAADASDDDPTAPPPPSAPAPLADHPFEASTFYAKDDKTEMGLPNHLTACRRRRIATQAYRQRCIGFDPIGSVKRNATVDETICAVFGKEKITDPKPINLSAHERPFTIKEICDLVMPTYCEVLDCGYNQHDIHEWVCGRVSKSSFTRSSGNAIFLGTDPALGWHFHERIGVTSSEHVFDACWRLDGKLVKEEGDRPAGDGGPVVGVPVGNGQAADRGASSAWEAQLWRVAAETARKIDKFQIDKLQVFDRIAQLVMSTQEKHVLLHIMSDKPTVWDHSAPPLGFSDREQRNQTAMRTPRNDAEPAPGVCFNAQLKELHPHFDPIVGKPSAMAKNVIPLLAGGWRTAATAQPTDHALRDSRTPKLKDLGFKTDDLAACRLDTLVNRQLLPAARALTSAEVQYAPPVRLQYDQLVINSAYFVDFGRLQREIDFYMLTIPGLRCNFATQAKAQDRGDTINHLDEEGEASEAAETAGGPETAATTDAASASGPSEGGEESEGGEGGEEGEEGEESKGGEVAVVDAAPVASAATPAKMHLGDDVEAARAFYNHTNRAACKILTEKRTEVTAEDIQWCISEIGTSTLAQNTAGAIFDKISIFYTWQIFQFFNFADHKFFAVVSKAVDSDTSESGFGDNDEIVEAIPETATCFLELRDHHQASLQSEEPLKHLSHAKTFKFEQSGKEDAKSARNSFTPYELTTIQLKHWRKHNVWIDDPAELRRLAEQTVAIPTSSKLMFFERTKWCEATIEAKIAQGFVRRGTSDALAIADTGLCILARLRIAMAKETVVAPNSVALQSQAGFLRPLRFEARNLTCAETERNAVKIGIEEGIRNQLQAEARKQNKTLPPPAPPPPPSGSAVVDTQGNLDSGMCDTDAI